jgi:hypothetical protein
MPFKDTQNGRTNYHIVCPKCGAASLHTILNANAHACTKFRTELLQCTECSHKQQAIFKFEDWVKEAEK